MSLKKVKQEKEEHLVVVKHPKWKKEKRVVFYPNLPPKDIDVIDDWYYK